MKALRIFISPEHNYFGHHGKPPGEEPMVEVESVECVAGRGLKGDRFFDFKEDYKGQITFFSQQVYEALCEEFETDELSPSVFRRNVIVDCEDLNALVGTEFEIQGIRFQGVEEAKPCYWMNSAVGEGAEEAMRGRGGLRAKILTSGELKAETVEVR